MSGTQALGVVILVSCALAVLMTWAVGRWPGRSLDILLVLIGGALLALPVAGVALVLGWTP